MTELDFIEVTATDKIAELADMAACIWNEYWPPIIGQAQTDYMVDKLQSAEALERDLMEAATNTGS